MDLRIELMYALSTCARIHRNAVEASGLADIEAHIWLAAHQQDIM